MGRFKNRRMPLSCEPCRERKIRCSRDGAGACQSCIHRGIPPDECVYLRELRARKASQKRNSGAFQHVPNVSNQDLVERVRKLEEVLALPSYNPNSGPNLEGSGIASHLKPSSSQPSPSSAIRAEPRRLVGSDGSLLLRSGSGYERYVPFSSQLASTLRNISLTKDLDSDIDDFNTSDEFIFPHKGPQRGELLSILPPMSNCEVLKDIYLSVFAQLFHVLHDPSFHREYARFRANPECVPLSWLALLFAVLSVAVMALEEEDASLLHDLGSTTSAAKNIDILTSRYRAAAMQALEADNYLWRHNLHTLQALIIIIYSINHSHGSSWTLLGVARNIAFSLGCHLDPDNFDLGLVETEERRRCWAAVSMLYTIQNSTLGNLDPTPLPREVRLPLDVDDEQIVDGSLVPTGSRTTPSQMSYLLHKFRLYEICSQICAHVFSKRSNVSYEAVIELEQIVLAQHEAWNMQYLTDTQRSSLPDIHIVHLDILFGYSHQLLLLLHRPILVRHHGEHFANTSYSHAHVRHSELRCLESARELLTIHRRAHESQSFKPYRWYNAGLGSFHAFHAAVIIAYILGISTDLDAVYAGQLLSELKDSLDVFHTLAASGKSRICQRVLPILQRLCETLCQHSKSAVASSIVSRQPPANATSIEAEDCSHKQPVDAAQPHLDMLLESIRPQPWLSPSMINWNDWNSFIVG